MEEKSERSIFRMLKLVFATIAIISLFFVFYNIGIYTDNNEADAFAALDNGS